MMATLMRSFAPITRLVCAAVSAIPAEWKKRRLDRGVMIAPSWLSTFFSIHAGIKVHDSPRRLLYGMPNRNLRGIATAEQWKTLFAAQSGYLLDAMDILLYVFAINTLKHEFGLTNRMAGLVSSATLISSAAGGILCGILADRLGRTRTLVYTILLYSL